MVFNSAGKLPVAITKYNMAGYSKTCSLWNGYLWYVQPKIQAISPLKTHNENCRIRIVKPL